MEANILADRIANQLVAGFNGNPLPPNDEVWGRSLTVNSALIGDDRRANALATSPLTRLIDACRTRFPDTSFQSEGVHSTESGFVFTQVGRQPGSGLAIQCTCRVRLVQDKVRELWFEVDEYGILMQQGKICSAPGVSDSASRTTNQMAAEKFRQTLLARSATGNFLSHDVVVHTNIETYRDISRGVETESLRLEGAGKFNEVLGLLRNRFHDPIDLTFADGISQGFTTTFRGKIRAKVGSELQRYNLVCGFVSPSEKVTEFWINITPPPTLMECLL